MVVFTRTVLAPAIVQILNKKGLMHRATLIDELNIRIILRFLSQNPVNPPAAITNLLQRFDPANYKRPFEYLTDEELREQISAIFRQPKTRAAGL